MSSTRTQEQRSALALGRVLPGMPSHAEQCSTWRLGTGAYGAPAAPG